jgi:hypothetical protein
MRTLTTIALAGVAAIGMAAALSCGGTSTNATSPAGACTPSSSPATFVIMNGTICPQTMTISRGTQVTMSNQDTRTHEMDSDPHPEHTDCPELNSIDFLNPGQSRQSQNLNTARTCGFHDHGDPNNAAMKGSILIQ